MRSCPGQPSRLNGRSESCGSVVNRRLTEALVFGFLMPHRCPWLRLRKRAANNTSRAGQRPSSSAFSYPMSRERAANCGFRQ